MLSDNLIPEALCEAKETRGEKEESGCKSHFHTWLGSEIESRMWLAICKNMSNWFGK
jgi:hypothetical protein